MSVDLELEDVDQDLIDRLMLRALRNGRSIEDEHRAILYDVLLGETDASFETLAAEARKLTQGTHQTPSETLLSESREQR